MRSIALILLVALFFLALTPEWSILSIGKELAKNQDIATLIIQAFLVLLAIGVVALIYFNLPFGKKGGHRE